MSVQQIEETLDNILYYEEIKGGKEEEHVPKLKADGTEKRTPNNNSVKRRVDPIRKKEDLHLVINYLHDKATSATRYDKMKGAYRDWALFVIGTNVGVRVSDLIVLKWDDIYKPDMKTFWDGENIKEKKTGKIRLICPNEYIRDVLREYLYYTETTPLSGEFIFTSGRKSKDGTFPPISDAAVEKMIKLATSACGLEGNYNTHSLRKTFAYHMYEYLNNKGNNKALVIVQTFLNHRNTSDTVKYLGIARDELIDFSMGLGEYLRM